MQTVTTVFPNGLGRVVMTPTVAAVAQQNNIDLVSLLRRHLRGDWGNLPSPDVEINNEQVAQGGQVMSSYDVGPHKIWIITDPGHRNTTVLLPTDYYAQTMNSLPTLDLRDAFLFVVAGALVRPFVRP